MASQEHLPCGVKLLSALKPEDISQAGNKAYSLSELINLGLPVPEGLVVLVPTVKELLNSSLSEKDTVLLAHAIEQLPSNTVAVRSSSLVEDSSGVSFAGHFQTFLDIPKNEALEKIVACGKAIPDGHTSDMAVIVQSMIDGECAGVAFSVDPVRMNSDRVVIEAGYRDQVVSGVSTPDRYYFSKTLGSVVARRGNRLNDGDIKTLTTFVQSIEGNSKYPVDVEWVKEDGKLFILQARPVTGLGTALRRNLDDDYPDLLDLNNPWRLEIERAYTLFTASLWCRWFSHPEIKAYGIELTEFLNTEAVPGKIKHYRNPNQMDNFRNLLQNFVENQPDKVRQLITKGLEINEQAKIKIEQGEKSFSSLEEAVVFYQQVGAFGTGIARPLLAILEVNRTDDNLLALGTQLRAVSFAHPLVDAVIRPLAINRLRSLDLDKSQNVIDLLTISEILDRNLLALPYRLRARERGKLFNYQVINGDEVVIWGEKITDASEQVKQLRGEVAFPGFATGPASIALSANPTMVRFEEGSVLVSLSANRSLYPLIEHCSALVTEEGGILSHPAINAREYGKPSLMGVEKATELIQQGQNLEVDANNGIITTTTP